MAVASVLSPKGQARHRNRAAAPVSMFRDVWMPGGRTANLPQTLLQGGSEGERAPGLDLA